jgi:small subunit ribosomal protein S17
MSDPVAELNENTKRKRILTGVVASDKMDKTIVVQVASRKLHRLYKKYVNMSKKFKAHDENNEAKVGDRVRVIESRPYSREKRWRLLEIVERAR